jgi:hypothetical protein
MLGLNDENIAHRDLDLGRFPAGHEKYDSAYVLDRWPDIIILSDIVSPQPRGETEYRAVIGATLIPAVIDMLAQPRLNWQYQFRAAQISEGKWLTVLVRGDAAAVLAQTEPAPP